MKLRELVEQVQELKDINEIKDITYQYWHSVDTKNPDRLREVFAPGEIYINFTDMPVWRDRDAFVNFYRGLALDPARLENHFGSSPKIKIKDRNNASGNWRLHMVAYNFSSMTMMRVTGEYDVKYSRKLDRWMISSFVFTRHSLFSANVSPDGGVNIPDFGGVSLNASAHLFGSEAASG